MATVVKEFSISLVLFLALFQLVSSKAQWYMAGDGHGYYIDDELKYNWLEANDECARKDMQLVNFQSQAKIRYLGDLLRSELASATSLYLGIQDELNKSKNKSRPFYAVASGEESLYFNWQPGQPDNKDSEEHCVSIQNVTDFKWNDVRCDNKYGFICETNHLTAKYRIHMEAQRLEVNHKNKKLSGKFYHVQADIKSINEQTRKKTDSMLLDLKKSTDEIIANVKQGIKDVIMKKPDLKEVMADLYDSISEVIVENEKQFDEVSFEARYMIEDVHLDAAHSTNDINLIFAGELATNYHAIDEMLVY